MKKYRKKILKLFILFIILNLSSLTFVQAQEVLQTENLETSYPIEFVEAESLKTYPTEILDAEASIWKIYNETINGSGFFIAPNLFVTNFHVLSGLLKHERNLNDIYLTQELNFNILTIKQVVSISALYDLAIIETKEASQHYLTLNESPLKTNEKNFITGYPSGYFTIMETIGRIDYENDYFSSFPVNHSKLEGASGSPVLNHQGQVVGVFSESLNNLTFKIKQNHLKNLITGDTGLNCKSKNIKTCLKKEIENLKTLAEQGNPLAQYQLAYIYSNGDGVPQNYELTVYWLEKASEQGYALAQLHLGSMHDKGEGVPQNHEKAFALIQQAAEQKIAGAQLYLGLMYLKGEGVPQNHKKAFDLIQQAAEQGDAEAQLHLGLMHLNGEGVPQNHKKAFDLIQQAALQKLAVAQKKLGLMYLNGDGVTQNYKLAKYWLKKAALQELASAQKDLGLMHKNGQGVPQNYELAQFWLQKAAEQNNKEAQENIG